MNEKDFLSLIFRYFILLVLGSFNLFIFYFIFTPLTVKPTFWIISLLDSNATLLEGNLLFFGGLYAEIIDACVAGAAYYLLTILNLSTPMDAKNRFKSLGFVLGLFLILNVARILLFAALLVEGYQFFDLAHKLTWYFGSTILVVLIWFANVFLFKIKEIPIYTDFKMILSTIKQRKNDK